MPSSTNTSPSSSQSSNTLGEIPNLPTAQVTYPPTADLIFEGEVCEDIHTIEIYSMKLRRPHITSLLLTISTLWNRMRHTQRFHHQLRSLVPAQTQH